MINYQYNDGGRSAYYKGYARDCVVRATGIILRRDYKEVYKIMANANHKAGFRRSAREGIHKRVYGSMWEQMGIIPVHLPLGPKPTYTEAHDEYGNCIVSTRGHVASIINGSLRDTFDGRTYEWEDEIRERKALKVWVPT